MLRDASLVNCSPTSVNALESARLSVFGSRLCFDLSPRVRPIELFRRQIANFGIPLVQLLFPLVHFQRLFEPFVEAAGQPDRVFLFAQDVNGVDRRIDSWPVGQVVLGEDPQLDCLGAIRSNCGENVAVIAGTSSASGLPA